MSDRVPPSASTPQPGAEVSTRSRASTSSPLTAARTIRIKSRRSKLPTDRVLIQPDEDFAMEFTALCHPMPQHLRRGRNAVTGKVIAYPDDPSGRYRHMIQLLEMRAREAAGGRTVLGPVALEVVWLFEADADRLSTWRDDLTAYPHTNTPDTDNLLKPLKDAITRAKLWADDKQVSHENLMKRWVRGIPSQIRVYITRDHVDTAAPSAAPR